MGRSVCGGGGAGPGSVGPNPAWVLLQVLTALGQDKAATLLGAVARLVCHVDAENVVGHEAEHIHVARVLCVSGIVRGPVEAAGGDLILQFSVGVLPSRTEQPVTASGPRGSVHGRSWRWGWSSPSPTNPSQGRFPLPWSSPGGLVPAPGSTPSSDQTHSITQSSNSQLQKSGHSCLNAF